MMRAGLRGRGRLKIFVGWSGYQISPDIRLKQNTAYDILARFVDRYLLGRIPAIRLARYLVGWKFRWIVYIPPDTGYTFLFKQADTHTHFLYDIKNIFQYLQKHLWTPSLT